MLVHRARVNETLHISKPEKQLQQQWPPSERIASSSVMFTENRIQNGRVCSLCGECTCAVANYEEIIVRFVKKRENFVWFAKLSLARAYVKRIF